MQKRDIEPHIPSMSFSYTNVNGSRAHIHIPTPTERYIGKMHCSDCSKRSWMLFWFFEFGGTDSICLKCGRRCSDGNLMPIEHDRDARKRSIEKAKKRWREETRLFKWAEQKLDEEHNGNSIS